MEVLEAVLPLQVSFCAFDFSGAGHSEGRYVSFGYYEQEDLTSILSYLRSQGLPEAILWGRSMGAVAALLYTCSHEGIRAVVADSPFASLKELLRDVINSYVPLPSLVTDFLIARLQTSILSLADFDLE